MLHWTCKIFGILWLSETSDARLLVSLSSNVMTWCVCVCVCELEAHLLVYRCSRSVVSRASACAAGGRQGVATEVKVVVGVNVKVVAADDGVPRHRRWIRLMMMMKW